MKFDLLDEKSIILNIGNIKLSDTGDTFGKRKIVGGYEYHPILKPNDMFPSNLVAPIAYGDYRRGTSISDGKNEMILAYGANRINSNAQSMSVGYFDGSQYFFVVEAFGDIYAEKQNRLPELTRRSIVTCKSLWDDDSDTTMTTILNHEEVEKRPTEENITCFRELISRVECLESAFRGENLEVLRRRKSRAAVEHDHDR